jgi:hypothetical protein
MKKTLLTTAIAVMMCISAFAQTVYEWKKPPKSTEIEIGVITGKTPAGSAVYFKYNNTFSDGRFTKTDEEVYEYLLEEARKKYGESYPNFALRNFKSKWEDYDSGDYTYRYYNSSATVVIPDKEAISNEKLSQSLDKALRNVREGSRLAIDQISVKTGMNREDYKDQLIDILLDKGYRVVAKEYLDKLYEEIKDQESGIYNDGTTVKPDNFSAVGYYINVKVTETSLRVQVVNVSTGEYEGNATVNF